MNRLRFFSIPHRLGAASEGAGNTPGSLTVNRRMEAILALTNPIPDEGRFPPIPSPNDERRAQGFEPIGAVVARILAKAEKREGGE